MVMDAHGMQDMTPHPQIRKHVLSRCELFEAQHSVLAKGMTATPAVVKRLDQQF